MTILLYVGRGILLLGVGLVLFVLGYLLAAYTLSSIPTRTSQRPCPVTDTVFVSDNGVHLSLALSLRSLPDSLRRSLILHPATRYAVFGMGERDFYVKVGSWEDLDWKLALRAALLPTPSLIRVYGRQTMDSLWLVVPVCADQHRRIIEYIAHSLKWGTEGKALLCVDTSYGQYDRFYHSRHTYHLWFTCNNWVNGALKYADIPTCRWSPFSGPLMRCLGKRHDPRP